MKHQPIHIRHGITLFPGRVSRNLIFSPMVSNSYFLEDSAEAVLFDASCGKEMGQAIETHIRERQQSGAHWERGILIAGHSHMDHANNFYLGHVLGATETHIFLHEAGFRKGRVLNDPATFIQDVTKAAARYYNPYWSFPFPYNLLMAPFAALHLFSPALAREIFALLGSLPWPEPVEGVVKPEPLRESEKETLSIGEIGVTGWRLGSKIILPTPGHSPCSVSLFWPEQKALFISDADWFGNPVFLSSSLRDAVASLGLMKEMAEADLVDLLLPGHGPVIEGREAVLNHLNYHIRRQLAMRDEVLLAHHKLGGEKDVGTLTRYLVENSPLFRMLHLINYPRMVVFAHNVVAVCLIEAGILD